MTLQEERSEGTGTGQEAAGLEASSAVAGLLDGVAGRRGGRAGGGARGSRVRAVARDGVGRGRRVGRGSRAANGGCE